MTIDDVVQICNRGLYIICMLLYIIYTYICYYIHMYIVEISVKGFNIIFG